jgi:hypothetical protein
MHRNADMHPVTGSGIRTDDVSVPGMQDSANLQTAWPLSQLLFINTLHTNVFIYFCSSCFIDLVICLFTANLMYVYLLM